MADVGDEAGDSLISALGELARAGVTQAHGVLDTLLAGIQSAAEAAGHGGERALDLPNEVLEQLRSVAREGNSLGTLIWGLLALADSLAPAGVSLTAYNPDPANGRPRGLAITYRRDGAELALALNLADPAGGGLVLSAFGPPDASFDLPGNPAHLTVTGLSNNQLQVPFTGPIALDAAATVTVGLALSIGRALGPVTIGPLTFGLTVSHGASGLTYRAELALRDTVFDHDFAGPLGGLASVVDLSGMQRTLDLIVVLEDGHLRVAQLAGTPS